MTDADQCAGACLDHGGAPSPWSNPEDESGCGVGELKDDPPRGERFGELMRARWQGSSGVYTNYERPNGFYVFGVGTETTKPWVDAA